MESLVTSLFSELLRLVCASPVRHRVRLSPAVPQKALQDVGGPRRAEDGPLDAPVFEVAAVDLVGTEPLFDSLLDAVPLGETYRAGSRRETVIHEVHGILQEEEEKKRRIGHKY